MERLEILYGVVINRSDIGDDKVELYCKRKGIPILMRIPFDKEIAYLYSKGIPIVEKKKEYVQRFNDMFYMIKYIILEKQKYNI